VLKNEATGSGSGPKSGNISGLELFKASNPCDERSCDFYRERFNRKPSFDEHRELHLQ
jgi:hypothetical protein